MLKCFLVTETSNVERKLGLLVVPEKTDLNWSFSCFQHVVLQHVACWLLLGVFSCAVNPETWNNP